MRDPSELDPGRTEPPVSCDDGGPLGRPETSNSNLPRPAPRGPENSNRPAIRYWLIDDDKARRLPVRSTLDRAEALRLSATGYGTLWCPNLPTAPVRQDELVQVAAWGYADVDCGVENKAEALARADALPCPPTLTVETRSGFHHYWRANISRDLWDAIVRWRLVPAVDGDRRATDRVRLLRVPGFLHQKDRANPFPVEVVRRRPGVYPIEALLALPEHRPEEPRPAPVRRPAVDADDFYTALESLDQGDVLAAISGTWLVGGEVITFARSTRGRRNVVINGRQTSNFIDERGRIGAHPTPGRKDGGPHCASWCRFYGHDDKTIRNGLADLVPELARFKKGGRHAA